MMSQWIDHHVQLFNAVLRGTEPVACGQTSSPEPRDGSVPGPLAFGSGLAGVPIEHPGGLFTGRDQPDHLKRAVQHGRSGLNRRPRCMRGQ